MMKIRSTIARLFDALKGTKSATKDNPDDHLSETLLQDRDLDPSGFPPCPKCKASQTSKIIYGKPALTRQMLSGLESGRIISGGCMIRPGAPKWHCPRCRHDFGRLKTN